MNKPKINSVNGEANFNNSSCLHTSHQQILLWWKIGQIADTIQIVQEANDGQTWYLLFTFDANVWWQNFII